MPEPKVEEKKVEVKEETKPEEKVEVKEEEKKEEQKPEVKVEIEEKPEEKPIEEKKKEEKPQVDVQARINRMYARLQEERKRREGSAKSLITKNKEEGAEEEVEEKAFTAEDAEAIWARKEKEKRFVTSETKVLMRHPSALNEDGTFNMNDAFTKEYIAVGRENQQLVYMDNGPELAEAMVEKRLGTTYKKGRVDEAERGKKVNGAHTTTSTVAKTATEVIKISEIEAKIAARMGMTPAKYLEYKQKIAKGDKRV